MIGCSSSYSCLDVHPCVGLCCSNLTTFLPLNTSHKALIRLRGDERRVLTGIVWKEWELKDLNEQVMTWVKYSAFYLLRFFVVGLFG